MLKRLCRLPVHVPETLLSVLYFADETIMFAVVYTEKAVCVLRHCVDSVWNMIFRRSSIAVQPEFDSSTVGFVIIDQSFELTISSMHTIRTTCTP